MKAIVCNKYGSPDLLQLKEVEKPVPAENEVLLKVHAASINPLDWHIMRGSPFLGRFAFGLFKPKYPILGADVAGRVESVGKNISRFKPGDEVFGDIFPTGLGGLAEYVCTTESMLVLKPKGLTFEQAAAIPVAGLTALTSLRDVGKVQPGQKVLINGASGGVGTFTVQIARSYGADVTGVCSTGNLDMIKSIGADQAIDYTQEDILKNEPKYDLIVDNVGNLSVKYYKKLLTPVGIAAVVGFSGMTRLLDVSLLGGKKIGMVNVKTNREDLDFLKELMITGKMKPVIDREYFLAEAPEALAYLEEGHARGKVIIKMSPE